MTIFKMIDQRFQSNGRALARGRAATGLNMSEFAYKCGWTCSYQWKLENDRVETVSEGTKNVMEGVLSWTKLG